MLNEWSYKHGHCLNGQQSRTYRIWHGIKCRILNPDERNRKYYTSRGIKMAAKWNDFEGFLEDMGECPPGLTIDRINNDGHYCKENCRWATRQQQSNNRRDNRLLTYQCRTQTMTQWSRELGIRVWLIWDRLKKGWTVDECLSTPGGRCTMITWEGKTQSISDWAREKGVKKVTATGRLARGYPPEVAFSKNNLPSGKRRVKTVAS